MDWLYRPNTKHWHYRVSEWKNAVAAVRIIALISLGIAGTMMSGSGRLIEHYRVIMHFTPEQFGWRADNGMFFDTRDIRGVLRVEVNKRGPEVEAVFGGLPPTHAVSTILQYSPNGMHGMLRLENLRHVRTVNGGHRPRKGETQKVDCASYTYGLYLENEFGHPRTVIVEKHGGGITFYELPDTFLDQTMESLAVKLDDGEFWDVLKNMVEAYGHGREHGNVTTAKNLCEAFAEGRLHKRKIRGQDKVKVLITPRPCIIDRTMLPPSHPLSITG